MQVPLARWDAGAMRVAIDDSIQELAKVGAPPTWVLSNTTSRGT